MTGENTLKRISKRFLRDSSLIQTDSESIEHDEKTSEPGFVEELNQVIR